MIKKRGKLRQHIPGDILAAKETWKVFKIMSEFVDAFDELKELGPAVTIWGSARTQPDHPFYKLTENVAYTLSKAGYDIITGGGPGLMQAANKGAERGKVRSVGLNIDIASEQNCNDYVNLGIDFKYFFIRKVMFVKYASAFVIMPGGFGTMDEFFECLTLMQTDKTKLFPVILMGKEYWSGMVDWLKNTVAVHGMIDKKDLSLFNITDDPKEVLKIIRNASPVAKKHRKASK